MNESDQDLIEYYLEEQRYHGKAATTLADYERVLRRFERFLEGADDELTPATAGRRACMAWIHDLRNDVSPSTVASYASYVHRFYDYMLQIDALDSNPMALVMEELDEGIDTVPPRRDVGLEDMAGFLDTVAHPLERALILTLLKTGMRVGECVNLDCRDLNVSVDIPGKAPRSTLEGRGPSIYIPSGPAVEQPYNGETRTAANKRKRDTIVPVDDELEGVLLKWLQIRPDSPSPADPLFVSTQQQEWGKRLSTDNVRYIVRKHAKDNGWYRTGDGPVENVTPHYFRHFFTTHLRDRTGDRGIVKYLRGDVGDDIIDTYTHNWGDRVRAAYLDNIYRLL